MPSSRPPSASAVARIGFGCVKLGGAQTRVGDQRLVRLVREAIDLGVVFFDTADAYGSGRSEAILGSALGASRSDVVLATKGGYLFDEARVNGFGAWIVGPVSAAWNRLRPGGTRQYQAQDFSPQYLRHAVDASLRRLRTDHIDIYQLHAPREMCGEATFAALEDLVRVGKIGQIGVGFESIEGADRWLDVEVVTRVQVPFGILDPQARTSLLPEAASRGVDVMVRGVLASGLLDADESDIGEHLDRPKFTLLERLRVIARDGGLAMHDLALRWVLAQSLAGTVLVGINSSAHLHAVVKAASAPPLEKEITTRVDELLDSYVAERASQ